MYFILVFNICTEYDLMILKLDELDKLISDNDDGSLDDSIHDKLFDIIRYHQRLNDFISKFDEVYSYQLFMEISVDALQVLITLFVMYIELWMPGFVVITVATFQLLLYSLLGTLIEIKTDAFTDRIYDVQWHELAKKDQKIIEIMLLTSQTPNLLTYGGLLPLNVNFFQSLYRKIYSVLMMLQNLNE
ncbi:uncharacterized protein LOC128746202 [Sabethes cyaneus]|uniref:uncharacterized protein LOC128746202 n=1 Tax=Sabethes cyaneus TaxID=53552 RepID=UPI00237E4BD9|nr:uncharacterized protein LOC128746202 [Sabethes cyaneus]